MGKYSKAWGVICSVALTLLGTGNLHAQDDEDSTGPEVWGPLWEPAWEGGWFTQASPFTLDVALGRRTFSDGPGSDALLASRSSEKSELYALARVSLPWETFLPQSNAELPLLQRSVSSERSIPFAAVSEDAVPKDAASKDAASSDAGSSTAESEADSSLQWRSSRVSHDAQETALDGRGALLVLVRALVEQVKIAPGHQATRARLDSLIHRSRVSGLVPELRLRGVYGFDQTTSLEDTTGLYPGETTTRGGHDSLLEARLTFRLDRLVLGDSEGTLERQRVQLGEEDGKRISQALSHLLKWKTAAAQALDASLLPDEQAEALIVEEAALAHLHLLTAGWFRGRATVKALGIERALFPPTSAVAEQHRSPEQVAEESLPDERDAQPKNSASPH